MGADIHTFVEYKTKIRGKNSWQSFSADELLMERDYTMFYILAEVGWECPNSFKAKGKIPFNKLSSWVKNRRTEKIGEYDKEYGGCTGDCTIEDAIGYKEKFGCRIHYVNKVPYRVDSPDYHTDTWLTFSEYEQALKYYKDYTKEVPLKGYLALYEVMKVYHTAGYETRLIIYFDN
jgi:hypothetical protein